MSRPGERCIHITKDRQERGEARIGTQMTAAHTTAQLDRAVAAFTEVAALAN